MSGWVVGRMEFCKPNGQTLLSGKNLGARYLFDNSSLAHEIQMVVVASSEINGQTWLFITQVL